MPWIDPQYLECAVYLYPSEKEAEDGDRIGGSGFVVGIDCGAPAVNYPHEVFRPKILCVVTNKHVIDSGNMVARINTMDGRHDIIPLDGARWYTHKDGDDLAVCPVRLSTAHSVLFYNVRSSNLITKKIIDDYEIGPGDDVFVIGRFVNHEGKQKNLPSARFGNIAQMPWEPIMIGGRPQESFLVEARSISGYSGAPVFVFCQLPPVPSNINPQVIKMVREGKIKLPGVSNKRLQIPIMLGPWLLGIDYCHIRWDEPIWSKITQRPVSDDWFIKSNTGMMGVVPAWKLAEILEGDDMKPIVDEVKQMVVKAAENDSKVELDVADLAKSVPPANGENPTHREDFTRLLGAAARKPARED
jgi:hypothetical protein